MDESNTTLSRTLRPAQEPVRTRPTTDRELPNLTNERTLLELPSLALSKTEIAPPTRTAEKLEVVLPRRIKDLSERALPHSTKATTLDDSPIRAKLATDSELPKCIESSTLAHPVKRANPRADIPEPTLAKARIDKLLPTVFWLAIEILLPKKPEFVQERRAPKRII